jgi:hypothetical protein
VLIAPDPPVSNLGKPLAVTELARLLALALADDVKRWPDGPPAEASATSGTQTSGRRAEKRWGKARAEPDGVPMPTSDLTRSKGERDGEDDA